MSPAAAGANLKQPRNKNTSAAAKAASATKSKGGATKHAALLYTLMTQRDSETLRGKLQRQQKKLLVELKDGK